jgi:hypothetical protein
MPKLNDGAIPKYRLHKQSGQVIVTLSGRDLGVYGSPESREKYNRLTGEWLAAGRQLPVVQQPSIAYRLPCQPHTIQACSCS